MIEFHYETEFGIPKQTYFADWISRVVNSEDHSIAQLDFIFCDDKYLLGINMKYLEHDTYTDVITFDYSNGRKLSGDVFLSVDRVKENAAKFSSDFEEELRRVMVHGVLHLMGYRDKTNVEKALMTAKEEEKLKMFHVEQ